MNFSVRIAKHIEEIGQESWDRCSQGRPFTSYRWFLFCQTVLSDSPAIYIQLSDSEGPIGRGSFWLMRQESLPIPTRLQPLAQAVFQRWPLCVCRTPVANRSGLALPEPPLAAAALQAITTAIEDQAREEHASFVLYDYLDVNDRRSQEQSSVLTWMSVADPSTFLAIRWPDFSTYLDGLSKSAWKDYRRHANRAGDLNLEISRHTQPPNLEEALPLIRAVEEHHQNAPLHYVQALLTHFGMVDGVWIEARVEGRLVGCGLLLSDGDEMTATMLGLDYRVKYVYFQIIYEAIRCAIEKGARKLYAGSGAYDLKRRLGFELEWNNQIAFTGASPLFTMLGRIGAKF